MDERRLEQALRQGPPFATRYQPSSLALDDALVDRRSIRARRLVLILAVTSLVLITLFAGLVAVGVKNDRHLAANGWIAFVRGDDGSRGPDWWTKRGIFLVRQGDPTTHQIAPSRVETLAQGCPRFSPDGRRLAHGEAEGSANDGYHGAALVISDLDATGNASESRRIDVGSTHSLPCAAWSADGRRVAFGVPLTSTNNPERTAAGSSVWVVTLADGHVDVLPDLLATDLEWSPDGAQLAIASGETALVPGESLRDGSIRVYDADRGDMRTLVGSSGVSSLTWSPDGTRIAYQRGGSDGAKFDQEIRVAQIDGSGDRSIARGFGSIFGVGPVWSPKGDRIVYQRMKSGGTEAHDVVLVSPDDGTQVVLPDVPAAGPQGPSSWRPASVTWSPDGNELLYTAWISGRAGGGLIARPLQPGLAPVVIQDQIVRGGDNNSWGRLPGR